MRIPFRHLLRALEVLAWTAFFAFALFFLVSRYWLLPNIGPALLLVAIVMGVLWIPVAVSTWILLRPPVTAARRVRLACSCCSAATSWGASSFTRWRAALFELSLQVTLQ